MESKKISNDLYNTFCQALDSGKEVRVVFCDIKKAFERVWHAGFIHKLKAAGLSGSLLKWFISYLADRKLRVVLPGAQSDWNFIHAGVQKSFPTWFHVIFVIYK